MTCEIVPEMLVHIWPECTLSISVCHIIVCIYTKEVPVWMVLAILLKYQEFRLKPIHSKYLFLSLKNSVTDQENLKFQSFIYL